jgi:hypothetical protein
MNNLKQISTELGSLLEDKNKAYGSAFSKSSEVLKILYPNGINPDQYTDLLLTTRILDKLFRIATDKSAFNEEPWKDIAGYGILGIYKEQQKDDF